MPQEHAARTPEYPSADGKHTIHAQPRLPNDSENPRAVAQVAHETLGCIGGIGRSAHFRCRFAAAFTELPVREDAFSKRRRSGEPAGLHSGGRGPLSR